ncbi:MAG: S41 family peptidase [bacterium]
MRNSKRRSPGLRFLRFGALLTLSLLASCPAWAGASEKRHAAGQGTAADEAQAYDKLGVLMQVLYLIRQDYVDADKTAFEPLIYDAIRGMVDGLDPFSSFLTPAEFKSMLDMTEGKFGGLGITVAEQNGRLTIIIPMDNSPASRVGIMPNDVIVKIGDAEVARLGYREAVSRLRGDPGTKLRLTLYRPSTEKSWEVTLQRAIIDNPGVQGPYFLPDGTAYIRLDEFSENTPAKFRAALAEVNDHKHQAPALILDLRDNPGGLLESAVAVCSQFLPPKKLVVFTEGRQPSQRKEFFTDPLKEHDLDRPLAILVNGNSASAAEIVAGCLQDWGRAVLVGEKTFGKGSVQNLIDLADGSALRLTTAKYYTPSKRIIHEHGIEPDLSVTVGEDSRAQVEMAIDAALNAKHAPDAATDPQLARALETLQSYNVFLKTRNRDYRAPRPVAPPAPPNVP